MFYVRQVSFVTVGIVAFVVVVVTVIAVVVVVVKVTMQLVPSGSQKCFTFDHFFWQVK